MIVLVLLIGLVLGRGVHLARTQRLAAEAIRKAGGLPLFTWQFEGEKFLPPSLRSAFAVPGVPAWLVDRLGVEYFGDIREVHFGGGWKAVGGRSPTAAEIDEALAHVGRLPELRELSLIDTPVTAAGLESLRGGTGLRALILDGTRVGDADLANLRGLDRLEVLKLDGTAVTDAGLVHLARLTRLNRLSLYQVHGVTDAGLAHLRGLSRLEHLYLHDTSVTPAGVREFQAAMPRVKIDP